jgi:hypothetical protein
MEEIESLKAILAEMNANMKIMQEKADANTEDIKSGQREIKSTINVFQENMDAWIADI